MSNDDENKTKQNPRLVSLDALRGFDMFWIIGGVPLVSALLALLGLEKIRSAFLQQMHHVPWDGFHAEDLIFPLFLFIAGVTMPFSIGRQIERGDDQWRINLKILKRGVLLVLLGCIYNGMLNFDFANLRYFSVLGRIGLAWMFAAFIFTKTSWKGQIAWAIGLLLGYWAALAFITVPGFGAGAGNLSIEGNLVGYLDRAFMIGRLNSGNFDPEGGFSLIPAISTALFGALTGLILKNADSKKERLQASAIMAIAGLLFIGIALLWNNVFPINKALWSSSFTMIAAGYSLLLITVFYLIMDVFDFKKWALPFILIGLNPIIIYIGAHRVINFHQIRNFFFAGVIDHLGGGWIPFCSAFSFMVVELVFLYILYRNKIFLKV